MRDDRDNDSDSSRVGGGKRSRVCLLVPSPKKQETKTKKVTLGEDISGE